MSVIVRTAGMVQGTPDWQLDRAYELETERELEKAYAEDDLPVIASYFDQADSLISKITGILCRAADLADKHGFSHRIDAMIEQLEDFQYQMNSSAKDMTGR